MNSRSLALAAMSVASLLALTAASAYDYDKYGRQIYTPADWVRDNIANTKSLNDSGRAMQADAAERMEKWKREVAEREAYNSPEARAARRQVHEESVAEWMLRLDREAEARVAHDKAEAARREALGKSIAQYERNKSFLEDLKTRIAIGDAAAARELIRTFENTLKYNAIAATNAVEVRRNVLDLTGQPEGIFAALAKESPRGTVWQLAWQASEKVRKNYAPWPAIRRLATTPGPTANDHCLLLLAHEFDQTEVITGKKQENLGRRCTVPDARRQLLMEVLAAEIHRSARLWQYTTDKGIEYLSGQGLGSALESLLDLQIAIDAGYNPKSPTFNFYAAGVEEAQPEFQATAGYSQPGHTMLGEYVTVKDHPARYFAPLEAPTSDSFYIMDPSVALILHEKMRQATNLGLREDTAITAFALAQQLEFRAPGLDFVMGVGDLGSFYHAYKNGDKPDYHFGDIMPGGKNGQHRILPGLIPIFTALATTRPDGLEAWLRTAPTLLRLHEADAAELTTCHDLALAISSEAATPAARQQLALSVNETFYPLKLVHALAFREKSPEAFIRLVFSLVATGVQAADPFIPQAMEDLAAALSAPEGDEAAAQQLDARWAWVKEMATKPTMRPLLAPVLLKAALNVRTGQEEILAAAGTGREYEVSRKLHPPFYRAVPMLLQLLEWKDISPAQRAHGIDLLIDCAKGEGFAVDQVVSVLEGFITSETDPINDHLAPLAAMGEYGRQRAGKIQLRMMKFPRDRLHYSLPWETIPAFAEDFSDDVPPDILAAVNVYRESPIGSPGRAKLANALVEMQLKADLENPFERLAEANLVEAGSWILDDGVGALALATLRQREQAEIPWAHPPAARLDQTASDLIAQRGDERCFRTRTREAIGFAALVTAYRKNTPGARELLLKTYDPGLGADTLFTLSEDGEGFFSNIGTCARLAAVGTTDAASWLQRVTALPEDFAANELPAGYIAAARGHPHPENVTAQLIRLLWHNRDEEVARVALRQLITDPEAPRLFGPAWQDVSPSPFKTEWMLELLNAKAEELLPEPENAPPTFRDQQVRNRVHRLTPPVAMLIAFSGERTTSALSRTLVKDAHDFLGKLAKFAAEEDPTLIPLYRRFSKHMVGLMPITSEHWALLAKGQLWPLPPDISEAD